MTMTAMENKTSSKNNLNESTHPLLDETIEMKSKDNVEQQEISLQNIDGDKSETKVETMVGEAKASLASKCKVLCPTQWAVGLDLSNRDDKHLNQQVDIKFNDVIGEVESNHSVDVVFRLAFILFSNVNIFVYQLVSGVLAIPCAIVWGVLFSLINVSFIWVLTPSIKVFNILLIVIHGLWAGLIRTFLHPIFEAVSLVKGPASNVVNPTPITTVV